ncbi:MAG: LamG domain-containing protein, partial [Candidatus Micrarchaeota archaeon]|nr:LamG domain-containing protein [Candidatus Micrarchaeota archaeon]
PKYVGSFNGAHHSYVSVGNFSSTAAATMTVWIAPNGDYTYRQNVMCGGNSGGSDVSARYVLGVLNVGMCPDGSWYTIITSGGSEQKACSGQKYNSTNFPAGKWVMLSITYDGSNVVFYKNGVVINTLTQTVSGGNLTAQPYMIGRAGAYSGLYFNGSIADVQIYNASLDNTTVKALYKEGIGGAPIDVGHLVAWWPLNGNANDYSGNNNQGTPTNVIWNANWQNGYSLPSS